LPKEKFPSRYPEDSLEHQIGVKLMYRMKYFMEVFEKQQGRVPTFNDIFVKSVELASEVAMFKDMYKKMFNIYINVRAKKGNIAELFEQIAGRVFADIQIQFALDPTLDIGTIEGYEEKDYEIRTPYSWFTLLHEFVHIYLKELDFPDDERVAYVIPAGIFYFFKYYDNRRESLDCFT